VGVGVGRARSGDGGAAGARSAAMILNLALFRPFSPLSAPLAGARSAAWAWCQSPACPTPTPPPPPPPCRGRGGARGGASWGQWRTRCCSSSSAPTPPPSPSAASVRRLSQPRPDCREMGAGRDLFKDCGILNGRREGGATEGEAEGGVWGARAGRPQHRRWAERGRVRTREAGARKQGEGGACAKCADADGVDGCVCVRAADGKVVSEMESAGPELVQVHYRPRTPAPRSRRRAVSGADGSSRGAVVV
jgi:hypothetical protein